MQKQSLVLSAPSDALKKALLRLNGHNFGAYFSKEIDRVVKDAFKACKKDFFDTYEPSDDEVPLCALALSNYALSEIGFGCNISLVLCYKDIRGYNARDFAIALEESLSTISSNFKVHILEISRLFNTLRHDIELKSKFCTMRYICASKRLYKEAKAELARVKEQGKDEFIRYHLNELKPYDDVLLLSQKPDLKSGYGGFFDYERALMLLNLEGSAKENALKFISEKEYSEFVLASEFLSSCMSALRISGGNDSIESAFLEPASRILCIKEKRELDVRVLLVAKALTSMQRIAVYSRYLLRANFASFFKSKLSFAKLRGAKASGDFYLIDNTIFTPLHAKPKTLISVLKSVNALSDEPFKFHIESILYFKHISVAKYDSSELLAFKKIFYRRYSFWILKALLDGEQLFGLIKPMEHTRHLAQFDNYKFSVDEYSLMCIYHLENIQDSNVGRLYDELSAENKALLKIVALMHEVAKSQGKTSATHGLQGANIFRSYASKLELSQTSTALGVTLIKNHSLMNKAIKGEINAQNTLNLISHIGSVEALKMLYILTYSIVNATNDGFYSSTMASTLRELYEGALTGFKSTSDKSLGEGRARAKKENLIKKNSAFLELSAEQKSRILNIISNLFFIKYKASGIINIALWAMECANISVKISSDEGLSVEMIVRRGWNVSMVLSKLSKLDLEYMEIFELFENKFFVKLKYAKSVESAKFASLESSIITALCDKGEASVSRPVILPNEVSCELGDEYAKININAKDSRGFMAYILACFERFSLRLANARIQTIKNRTRNLYLIEKDSSFERNFALFKEYITKDEKCVE